MRVGIDGLCEPRLTILFGGTIKNKYIYTQPAEIAIGIKRRAAHGALQLHGTIILSKSIHNMKHRLFFYGIAILSIFSSCDKTTHESQDDVNYVKVGLNVKADISTSVTPLTKASGNDLYGINVLKSTDNGTTYSAYAYGLFDDISNVSIEIPDNCLYTFKCRLIKDGKTRLFSVSDSYMNPFYGSTGTRTSVSNSFVVSSSYMDLESRVVTDALYYRAAVDSYYGRVSGFNPKTSSTVTLDMKRTVFGVKVVVTNLDSGKLHIDIDGAPRFTITSPDTQAQQNMTVYDVAKVVTQDNYSETVNCKFIWEKDASTQIEIASKDITFPVGKLTTINVTIEPATVDAGLNINIQSGDLTTGDTVDVSGSSNGSNTNVGN